MYVNSQMLSSTTDIATFFSDDLFSSAILYSLPHINSEDYVMSYLSREDLVSEECYGVDTLFGLVLFSVGATIEKDKDKIKTVDGFEPLSKIKLKSLNEIVESQKVTVTANTLTSKDISVERRPNVEFYKYDSTGKFSSSDSEQ